MRISIIAILAAAAVVFGPLSGGASAAPVVFEKCLVELIEESQVAAQESGELMAVLVRDGQQVSPDEVLARIDDKLAKLELDVRTTELAVAQKKSENTISVQFAEAAAKVYRADYYRMKEANERVRGSVPQADVLRTLLEYEQYRLQIEKSKFDLEIAAKEVDVSKAQVAAAQEHIVRREITAPWEGIVDEVFRHTGDWVQPGDPVLRLVRMDLLRINASISAANYSLDEVAGRSVTVKVKLARDTVETFKGKIAGVSPRVDGENRFMVWAAIQNKKRNNYWILLPGMEVEMTIHLD